MFDEAFRRRFERAATPAARSLARRGLTPNAVTAAAFAVSLGAAGLIALGAPRLGFAVWLLSRVGDGLDGVIARVSGRGSSFGGYLDITLDMTAYSAMVLGFAALYPSYGMAWAAVLTGYVLAITSTLALASAAEREQRLMSATNRGYQFTRGLAEAGETTCVYGFWAFVPSWIGPVAWVWCVLLLATGVMRSRLAWRHLQRQPPS